MYVLNKGRPSIVEGRRISYGDIPCDERKRMRLAAPTTKAIALQKEDLLEKTAPKKYKPGPILRKWRLAKYLPANKRAQNNSKDGKLRKDALRSISTDEDNTCVSSRKRKMSTNTSYTKGHEVDNTLSIDEAKVNRIASFKQAYAAKEARSELDAKRRRIVAALAKQNIQAEFNDVKQQTQRVSCDNGVVSREAYTCTSVSSTALKLRLTKIDDGSSRKRKRESC